jgi:hypothetical protein
MKPAYKITGKILKLVASISEKIGEVNSAHLHKPSTELRKKSRNSITNHLESLIILANQPYSLNLFLK